MHLIVAAAILGACLIVSAFLLVGRYETVAAGGGNRGYTVSTDRFTGQKVVCVGFNCREIGVEPDVNIEALMQEYGIPPAAENSN